VLASEEAPDVLNYPLLKFVQGRQDLRAVNAPKRRSALRLVASKLSIKSKISDEPLRFLATRPALRWFQALSFEFRPKGVQHVCAVNHQGKIGDLLVPKSLTSEFHSLNQAHREAPSERKDADSLQQPTSRVRLSPNGQHPTAAFVILSVVDYSCDFEIGKPEFVFMA
jgi:hypothetical protein